MCESTNYDPFVWDEMCREEEERAKRQEQWDRFGEVDAETLVRSQGESQSK